ncbi:NitT/TauT family transport system substrate-binding protein [Pelagimonas varians]|uniref:NMT1/THI5 like protein n=2 Tax=Pelagimonas varians TaxID=696760 RepID=A0A238JPL5_9RHOB|nr:NitT/TauT family transport system substrate-binding protein [Pelagimonas varians]SMX32609.1 NMT1/THI5 like protein [Pelagimonas varians]
MSFMKVLRSSAVALVALTGAAWAETPVLRAAVLQYGTVNWELDVIKHNEFDTRNGFSLEVQGVAGGSAAKVAFQGGEADVIVSDWLWVARQRAAGKDFVFIPYSRAVGALMVPADSDAQSLADLKGAKIGIAGGPLDKSWLILQAYAEQEYGFDLQAETEQVFGAPPLIFKTAIKGDLDGAINFWHFLAKMEAGGMKPLVSVDQAAEALGLDTQTPLLGYVLRGEMLRDNPELVQAMATASRNAKDLLASDEAEWDRLRPRMNASTDAQFDALKAGFRAGIPAAGPVDEKAAAKMLDLMARLGGEDLVGKAQELPEGVFVQPGS